MPSATRIAAALAGYQQPQKTLWTPRSGTPASNSGTTAALTVSVTPQIGDLMIMTWHGSRATTPFTAVSIADTGSGGWSAMGTIQTRGDMTGLCWSKQATSADFNGGSGITVTMTASGGTGAITAYGVCDLFFLPASEVGYTISQDLIAQGSVGTATTITLNPASGSSKVQTDEMAWISCASAATAPGALTGTNTFQGTTPARNATQLANPGLLLNTFRTYATLNEANLTASNNTWVATWTTSASLIVFAATFYWLA